MRLQECLTAAIECAAVLQDAMHKSVGWSDPVTPANDPKSGNAFSTGT